MTFRAILGTSEGHLGWICAIRGRFEVLLGHWGHLGDISGPFGGYFGTIWGGFVIFGAILRSFWDIGAIWGHFRAILGQFGVGL